MTHEPSGLKIIDRFSISLVRCEKRPTSPFGCKVGLRSVIIHSVLLCSSFKKSRKYSDVGKLNKINFDSLKRPDYVRTLTIRCRHLSRKESNPAAGVFRDFRNLDRLEIDRCHLKSLPSALFSGLQNLYSLVVKNAKLSVIPLDLFAYTPNMMTLDLAGNELRIEPYALRSLRNLIHLDLSNNSIDFVTNTLISLTKLKVLTMDNNRLTNIDFRRLPKTLTDLSLRNNFITTIHYVSGSVRNLRRIDLSGNRLDFIAGSGSINMLPPSLRQIDLSNNQIAFIEDKSLAELKMLAVLNLKDNQLTELKVESLSGPENRLRLLLGRNPFKCHCGIRWLIHSTEKTYPVVLDLSELNCSSLLNDNQKLSLTVADQRNLLICQYDILCPTSCICCDKPVCSCRSSCPPKCRCYRSANMESAQKTRNVVMCEKMRFDGSEEIPDTITELQINSVQLEQWDIKKLQKLRALETIRISNTSITDDQANSLYSSRVLMELQLSSTNITKVPSNIGNLSQLILIDNPLTQLTNGDISVSEIFPQSLKLEKNQL
ncbi:leucine Rich repeat-containing domain protein [Dictyocaulus viviparus]|uniref:Leucine Rich repeat-containing domain protein n=1 Tax=Dictyocaulus viviparus TaxID=29172 RepID=A0A0D8XMG8_DICVI|nr:leucine Rich repeat-containing domain protein [Dictyocaulus viviparus]